MEKQPTCEERVAEALASRMEDITAMWKAECEGNEEGPEDLGTLNEYGLSVSYIDPENGEPGYFCYLISWGGPSEEFRFYTDPGFRLYKIEFWYKDWFDGARLPVNGADLETLNEIWESWRDCDALEHWYQQAQEA